MSIIELTRCISSYASDLFAASRLAAGFQDESVYKHTRFYLENTRSLLESIQNYNDLTTTSLIEIVDSIAKNSNDVFENLGYSKVSSDDQEDLIWSAQNLESSCKTLIFPMMDKVLFFFFLNNINDINNINNKHK
jgi:hypothetical protein